MSRVALVTGGTRGIGAAISIALKNAGYKVAATYAGNDEKANTPDLAARGTAMTTVKPTRRDLSNKVSLNGKVVLNPTYGLTAPVDGEVRYLDVRPPTRTPTKATRVATVYDDDRKAHYIEVPGGSAFAGRLVDDRADVKAAWEKQGAVPLVMSPAEFDKYLRADIDKWANVVRMSGAKVN